MVTSPTHRPSRTAPLVIALAVSLWANEAKAIVEDIQWTPVVPVMGEPVTYFPRWEIPYLEVAEYKWEYKAVNACGDWIVDPSNSEYITFNETRPGTWQVRLTVTYHPNSGGNQQPPTVLTKNVTIAPITHAVIASGTNTPAGWYDPIVIRFKIMAGPTRDAGTFLGGLAQEFISERSMLSPPFADPHPDDDDAWSPDAPDPVFQLEGNEIVDIKGQTGFAPTGINFGQDYMTIKQELRYIYYDTCNMQRISYLGAFRLARVRHGWDQWRIEERPLNP